MKKFITTLIVVCLALSAVSCGVLDNPDALNEKFDEPIYNENVAPRPVFTDEEKAEQISKGRKLLKDITNAAKDENNKTFVIPAGDYGFEPKTAYTVMNSAFLLKDIKRTEDNPFTIIGEGVNFWFETTGNQSPNCTRNIHLVNCSNVKITGLTLDTYDSCSFDGTITEIDYENNRIRFKPHPGSKEITKKTINQFKACDDFRFIPLKANGEAMAPLYNVTGGWGPESVFLQDFKAAEVEGEYWIYPKTDSLLRITSTKNWKNTYGKNGYLEIGDHVVLPFEISIMELLNCEKITMENITSYVQEGGLWEQGGYGDHLWKNCYFGPRPGTNQILGASDGMCCATRHGSTYDGCTFGFTIDDPINIHGVWFKAKSIKGTKVQFTGMPVSIKEGDTIVAYFTDDGQEAATFTVTKVGKLQSGSNACVAQDGSSITLDKEMPAAYTNDFIVFRCPDCECDGWKIINCTFRNTYQRLLLASGSGIVDNCRFYNGGSKIELGCSCETTTYSEGGFVGDVEISNNVFYNMGNSAGACVIGADNVMEFESPSTGGNISIHDNVFVSCGQAFKVEHFKDVTIKDNIIANTLIPNNDGITDFESVVRSIKTNGSENVTGNKVLTTKFKTTKDANPMIQISDSLLEKIIRYARLSTVDGKTAVANIQNAIKD